MTFCSDYLAAFISRNTSVYTYVHVPLFLNEVNVRRWCFSYVCACVGSCGSWYEDITECSVMLAVLVECAQACLQLLCCGQHDCMGLDDNWMVSFSLPLLI